MYNLTAYDNATDILGIFTASNNTADGYLFSLFFMFCLGIVLFISFKAKYDTIISIMGASFLVGIIGVGGWALKLVPTTIVFIPIFLLIGSLVAFMISES